MKSDCLPNGFLAPTMRSYSVRPEKTKFLFAHTNTVALLKLAPRALDFCVLAPATIF